MLKTFQLSLILIFIFSIIVIGQQIKTPRPSPDATVTQMVGITEVSIDYSSPGVKGRKIFGELVPFGEVWRTGANEVTSITFSNPVKVNGNDLPAGTYGIHIIPGESEWEIIFSKDTKVDGSSTYDPAKDALRIKVKPEDHAFMERMTFLFTDVTDNSANVNLAWDKLIVPFKIETDTQELFLSNAREQLSWSPTFQAAQYCLTSNSNLEEALKWAEASCLINEVYWNTRVKAQLQNKLGMKDEAIITMEKAIDLGNKMEEAPFDFDNMKKMLEDWKK
ncbi:MAG: DUF2911 domain-containing protein [Ignavibacteriota bacterium]|jgi:hypothetical protein|nr:MAG: DUF2911 domain-containing protein [Chlorobiota bacterium]MBE7475481.1 DUF2911 domain-containing protein [Ignavibacteriales bacterium]MBL1122448.1 DUF2911 domain-containing protein [Ignavibacteriota bacterium]MBV6422010.1 hypothetical protein [Ignavibacteriaceae bacterium]MCE7856023.1 DUF2911 domain-containing protein [Ignavibacteria bacterium CHB3]MEB2296861.1 DUF2911 domain-containing protein [Ignavibacteria bacterium]